MPRFAMIGVRAAVFSTLACLTVQSARATDSALLKQKAAGESYVEFSTDLVQKITGPDGKPMQIKATTIFGLLQKTKAKGEGTTIELTLDRLHGEMSFNDAVKSVYDTDDPEFEEASPTHKDAFGAILNLPLMITLDGNGKATSVDGAAAIRKKLTDLGDQNFVAKSLADEEFGDRQVMSVYGESPVILCPNREVKVGESWSKTQADEYPQVGKVIVNYECKLDGIKKAGGREMAVVSFKGTMKKDESEKPAKDQRLGKIDASFSGSALFDIAAGRFTEIKRDTQAAIEVQPWWTKEPTVPLMKVDSGTKLTFNTGDVAARNKRKAEIAQSVADAKTRHDAEEQAAMAGPVDPVTPENAPTPWLQWGGTNRDFTSSATGLANRWPKDGPPKIWERPLGDGFSAILCDGDTLYTTYSIRDKADPLKGEEFVVALDAKNGKTKWEYKYDAPWTKDLQMEFGPGPHTTPLIVGDRLITVGCTAKMFCLAKDSGKMIWSKDLREEYKADLLSRGYGASPMAYKGTIVLPVSKEKGGAMMAFHVADGSLAWKGGEFEPGYASPMMVDVDGIEQLVAFSTDSVIGLDPADRSVKWTIKHPTQWGANISTPVWDAKNKTLFISSAYGMGSRGIKLAAAGSQVSAKETWFNPKMKIQHGDAVLVGDWVYGSSGDFGPTFLAGVNNKTGEFGWKSRGIARANVLYADGKLIVLDEDGALFLVKADPQKYRLLGKATGLFKKTAWTVPTLVGRTLYIRDRFKIMALDLGTKKS